MNPPTDLDTAQKIVSIVASIFQAGAVVLAAYFGIKGLRTWRRQLVGGKKFALAEDALAASYELLEAVVRVRSPAAFGSEGESRQKQEGETENVTRMRNTYFVPIERLRDVAGQYERLHGLMARCRIHFGEDVRPHFDKLLSSRWRISVAAGMLIRTCGDDRYYRTEEQAQQARKQREDWEAIIWEHGGPTDPDPFAKELLDATEALKKTLYPHLKD